MLGVPVLEIPVLQVPVLQVPVLQGPVLRVLMLRVRSVRGPTLTHGGSHHGPVAELESLLDRAIEGRVPRSRPEPTVNRVARVADDLFLGDHVEHGVHESRNEQADVVRERRQDCGSPHDRDPQGPREPLSGVELGVITGEAARQPSVIGSPVEVNLELALTVGIAIPAPQGKRSVRLEEQVTRGVVRMGKTQFDPADGMGVVAHSGIP